MSSLSLISCGKDLILVIASYLEFSDACALSRTCKSLRSTLRPFLPFVMLGTRDPISLSCNDYLTRSNFGSYVMKFENSSRIRLPAKPVEFHQWSSESTQVDGFDVVAFLMTGEVWIYNTWNLASAMWPCEELHQYRTKFSDKKEGDADITKDDFSIVGPVTSDRVMCKLLGVLRDRIVQTGQNEAFPMTHVLLFDYACQLFGWDVRGVEKFRDANHFFDRFQEVCNDNTFGRYDGEFCAHSCGMLFAQPVYDLAASVVHCTAKFEEQAKNVFVVSNFPVLSRKHYKKFTAPALAYLFMERLELTPLTRN